MIAVLCSPPLCFAIMSSPAYFATCVKPRVLADLVAHNCIRMHFSSCKIYTGELQQRGESQEIDVRGSLISVHLI